MLKTIKSLDELALNKNNGTKLIFSKNDNNKPASRRNNNNGKINRFDINRNSIENTKKSGKSKSKKTSKFWNLAKSRKKLSKNKNLLKFDTIEIEPKFLTLDTKITFNHL